MARNASGYRHDHRALRRRRGQWAFSLAKAKSPGPCIECWAAAFRWPCSGPCVDAMVMTTKCCLFCGAGLIRSAMIALCQYHRTADSPPPADTTGESGKETGRC